MKNKRIKKDVEMDRELISVHFLFFKERKDKIFKCEQCLAPTLIDIELLIPLSRSNPRQFGRR